MSARTIHLLHIEDDAVQQRLTAQLLTHLPEFHFDITNVVSEDDAVAEFGRGRHEFVLLDYHLTQGNGLSCLHKLRQRDRIVPIVAISGAATPEIAAELLHVGADDYLSKQDLTPDTLARSVREAMARADAWRREASPASTSPEVAHALALFEDLCKKFAAANADLVTTLDSFEAAARQAHTDPGQVQEVFERVCAGPDGVHRQLLRPLLLEVLLRLFGSTPGN